MPDDQYQTADSDEETTPGTETDQHPFVPREFSTDTETIERIRDALKRVA